MADKTVAAGLLSMVCAAAEPYGIAWSELLDAAALDPDDLTDPSLLVPAEAFEDLLRFVLRKSGDPAFGIRCAEATDLRTQGFFGYALLSSLTLRERIAVHLRYQSLRLLDWCEASFWVERDTAILEVVMGDLPSDLAPAIVDWGFAGSCIQLRKRAGPRPIDLQLWLTQPEQPHHRELRAITGGPVIFAAPCNRMTFAAEELDRSLAQADPHLESLATAQLDAQLAQVSASDGRQVLDEVRQRLTRRLAEDASLERIARDLRVSARTLQRQLSALGASFQQLLEEVRQQRAITYLVETNDAIEQVSARVGYGDPSNFRRAFRRWTGVAPLQFRAQHRPQPARDRVHSK